MVEENGTIEPTHNFGKSDGANRAVIIAASQWLGLVFLLIVIVLLLNHLLLDFLLLSHLLLDHLLLGCLLGYHLLSHLLPHEWEKPCQ
jgi:hypothetical protein